MVMQRHIESRENIFSVKHAVMHFHVEQLDGEHVGGLLQFRQRKKKRRAMPLFHPPLHWRAESFHTRGVSLLKNAENIEIRMFGVEFSRRCGTVQSGGFQISAVGSF